MDRFVRKNVDKMMGNNLSCRHMPRIWTEMFCSRISFFCAMYLIMGVLAFYMCELTFLPSPLKILYAACIWLGLIFFPLKK